MGFGSDCGAADTPAVFESGPAEIGMTFSTTLALPGVGERTEDAGDVVVPLHDPCVGVAETKVTPAGRTDADAERAAAGGLVAVLVIERSAGPFKCSDAPDHQETRRPRHPQRSRAGEPQ